MPKFRYLMMLLAAWVVLLPIVAYFESLLLYPDYQYFLLVDVIESYVFWSGILTGFFFFSYKIKVKEYVIMLLAICLVIIPGASIMESLFVAETSTWFFLFINFVEALLFSIGLFIGYMVADKQELLLSVQALVGYW